MYKILAQKRNFEIEKLIISNFICNNIFVADLRIYFTLIFLTVSTGKNLMKYCMFVCFILSHGSNGIVYGTDGPVYLEKIFSYFKGNRCQALLGKPKVFFIQACRGEQVDKGVMADHVFSNNIKKIPIEADFLIGYCTVPG